MKPIHIVLAIVGGAIAGAAVGLLVAPSKGSETRSKIMEILREKGIKLRKKELEDLAEKIEDQVEQHI